MEQVMRDGDAILEYEATDMFGVLALVLRERRLIFWCGASLGLLTALLVLVAPRTYTSTATFAVESPTGASTGSFAGISALAAQAGFGLPQGELSPDYFAAVLQSRELLQSVVYEAYPAGVRGTVGGASLIEIIGLQDLDSTRALERALRVLEREWVSVKVDGKTGIVGLTVTTPRPRLSVTLARYLLRNLNSFNVETRQSTARAEREFIEQRLGEAQERLRHAQRALEDFLERNRTFQNSPRLQLEWDRLQQQQQIEQEVYLTLRRAYEQARVAEVKDTPTFTHIDNPHIAASADRRHTLVKAIVGGAFGLIAGIVLAFMRHRPGDAVASGSYDAFLAETRAFRRAFAGLVARVEARIHIRHRG